MRMILLTEDQYNSLKNNSSSKEPSVTQSSEASKDTKSKEEIYSLGDIVKVKGYEECLVILKNDNFIVVKFLFSDRNTLYLKPKNSIEITNYEHISASVLKSILNAVYHKTILKDMYTTMPMKKFYETAFEMGVENTIEMIGASCNS